MLCLNIITIAIAFSTSRQFKIKRQIFSNIQKKAAQFQAVLKCVFISIQSVLLFFLQNAQLQLQLLQFYWEIPLIFVCIPHYSCTIKSVLLHKLNPIKKISNSF